MSNIIMFPRVPVRTSRSLEELARILDECYALGLETQVEVDTFLRDAKKQRSAI